MQKNISNYVLLFLTVFVLFPLQGMEIKERENNCGICFEDMTGLGKSVIRLKCGHIFDGVCAKKWFIDQYKMSCPLCRNEYNTV